MVVCRARLGHDNVPRRDHKVRVFPLCGVRNERRTKVSKLGQGERKDDCADGCETSTKTSGRMWFDSIHYTAKPDMVHSSTATGRRPSFKGTNSQIHGSNTPFVCIRTYRGGPDGSCLRCTAHSSSAIGHRSRSRRWRTSQCTAPAARIRSEGEQGKRNRFLNEHLSPRFQTKAAGAQVFFILADASHPLLRRKSQLCSYTHVPGSAPNCEGNEN